jgi:hypothetical protein
VESGGCGRVATGSFVGASGRSDKNVVAGEWPSAQHSMTGRLDLQPLGDNSDE